MTPTEALKYDADLLQAYLAAGGEIYNKSCRLSHSTVYDDNGFCFQDSNHLTGVGCSDYTAVALAEKVLGERLPADSRVEKNENGDYDWCKRYPSTSILKCRYCHKFIEQKKTDWFIQEIRPTNLSALLAAQKGDTK
jgi:hypothetical protein